MATLGDIQEGRAAYFKPDDVEDKSFIILESLTPESSIRSEKKKGKYEGATEEKETEYFNILIDLEGTQKDLSMSYTAIKQLVEVIPKAENWKGVKVYKGITKGTGKKIKYNWKYEGKVEAPAQQQLPAPSQDDKNPLVSDASTQLLKMVACSTSGINDTDFWKNAIVLTGGNLSGAMAMVAHLKEKGELFQDKEGFWKAGK